MKCPKCGSELRKGLSFCPKCGEVISASTKSESKPVNVDKKKTPAWLVVLAVLFFPISLTYLIIKSKMKTPIKIVLICVLWIFVIVVGGSEESKDTGNPSDSQSEYSDTVGDSEEPQDTEPISDTQSKEGNKTDETISETTENEEQLVTYYDRDETINLYLNRFNVANPDQLIDSSLFKVYYHHGSEHDDQIIFTRDDVEVVITGNSWSNSIKLVIDGSKDKTTDDYKLLFFQYARAFSPSLSDEKLETYWQAVLEDIINSPEFDEFDCSLQIYNEEIEYMIIEGEIS